MERGTKKEGWERRAEAEARKSSFELATRADSDAAKREIEFLCRNEHGVADTRVGKKWYLPAESVRVEL